MKTEKRRSQRIDLNEEGTLSWQAEDGMTYWERVKVMNLSDQGAIVELTQKLPGRQLVHLLVPSWKVDSSGTVRHVKQKGLKYLVGLELSATIKAAPARGRWT